LKRTQKTDGYNRKGVYVKKKNGGRKKETGGKVTEGVQYKISLAGHSWPEEKKSGPNPLRHIKKGRAGCNT